MKNLAWTFPLVLLALTPLGCGGGNGTADTGSPDVGDMDAAPREDGGIDRDAPPPSDTPGSDDAPERDAPGRDAPALDAGGADANCSPPLCEPPAPGCRYEGATACECGTLVCAPPTGTCDPACNRGEYCDLCASSPMCAVRPDDMGRICPAIYMPVCGCDGMTYSNSCALASAGIALMYAGECAAPPSECSPPCGPGETCELCRGGAYVCLAAGDAC